MFGRVCVFFFECVVFLGVFGPSIRPRLRSRTAASQVEGCCLQCVMSALLVLNVFETFGIRLPQLEDM